MNDSMLALCEYDNRCTVCFRGMAENKSNCSGCNEYYCECNCKELTPDEIRNGDGL